MNNSAGLANSFRLVSAVASINRRDARGRSILLFRTSPALVTKRNVVRRTAQRCFIFMCLPRFAYVCLNLSSS